ncbi:hypothetical protein BG011_001397, partial [Mortierella polycephala]
MVSLAPSSSSTHDVTSRKRKSSATKLSATSKPNTKSKGKVTGKKPHAYTIEQETSIAEQVADPDIWDSLNGPSQMNAFNRPKTAIREAIAAKFNNKFNTDDIAFEIDEAQLKNKIHGMMKCWKKAHLHFKQTGNGDLPSSTLKNKVLRTCHYYYTWEPFASRSLNLSLRDPIQLTDNLSRKAFTVDSDDADESNDEDNLRVRRSTDGNSTQETSRVQSLEPGQQAKEPARPHKKSRRAGAAEMFELIEDLGGKTYEDRELRKQNQISALNYQNQGLELERQKLHFQMEIEKRTASIQDDIH